MNDVPSWAAAAVASLLGFIGAWAALRVTVSSLKEDVVQLKTIVLTVTTLQAKTAQFESELERQRVHNHETRNKLQELIADISDLRALDGRVEGVVEQVRDISSRINRKERP